MARVKPISPEEVATLKTKIIPEEVIEAVNELIASRFSNGYANFTQKDLVALIKKKFKEHGKEAPSDKLIMDEHWLDFEDIYREEGWKVFYDKPGYNESYNATFEFKIADGKYA